MDGYSLFDMLLTENLQNSFVVKRFSAKYGSHNLVSTELKVKLYLSIVVPTAATTRNWDMEEHLS